MSKRRCRDQPSIIVNTSPDSPSLNLIVMEGFEYLNVVGDLMPLVMSQGKQVLGEGLY